MLWLIYGWHWYKGPAETPRGDWLFGGFLFILPVLNPWYLVWVLPFAVVWPSITAWVASFAILFAYAIGLTLDSSSNLIGYQQPFWALFLEYSLILLALVCDLKKKWFLLWAPGSIKNSI